MYVGKLVSFYKKVYVKHRLLGYVDA